MPTWNAYNHIKQVIMFLVNWLLGKQQRKTEIVAPTSVPPIKKDSKNAKIE